MKRYPTFILYSGGELPVLVSARRLCPKPDSCYHSGGAHGHPGAANGDNHFANFNAFYA
jgi:hypothetical protein